MPRASILRRKLLPLRDNHRMRAMQQQLVQQQRIKSREERIKEAKERRFTLTGKILTGKEIRVGVIDDSSSPPAYINMKTLDLVLNEAFPRANNPVDALIYDRAKMYHEIGHAEFTDSIKHREDLAKKSKNPQMFLDMSNVLEDGREERLVKERWAGTGDYLDALLAQCVKDSSPEMIGGLVLYVRTKMLRNDAERAYWKPFLGMIDKAVAADKTRVALDVAFEITEAIAEEAKQPQGEGEGKEQGKEQGKESKPESNEAESNEAESNEDSEDDSGNEPESNEDGENEGESKPEGEDSQKGQDESGNDSEGSGAGGIDEEVENAIRKIVEEAVESVEAEAEAEHEAILEEAEEEVDGTQQFKDGNEEAASDELSQMFTSLLVEQNRVKYSRSREGMLDTQALPNALTNRKCFQVREEVLGAPYVVLLIDVSGSQSHRASKLTEAARIVHGALQKANVETLMITFGSHAAKIRTVPIEKDLGIYGSTNTGLAMQLGNDWIAEQNASRALMVVMTDGAPDEEEYTARELSRCEDMNGHVLGVRIGVHETAWAQNPEMQWHDYISVMDVAKLPSMLQPKLEAFIAGE